MLGESEAQRADGFGCIPLTPVGEPQALPLRNQRAERQGFVERPSFGFPCRRFTFACQVGPLATSPISPAPRPARSLVIWPSMNQGECGAPASMAVLSE